MKRIQYTGNNYTELKQLFGDRLLAPMTAWVSACFP